MSKHKIYPDEILLPALPGEEYGWGRLKRIVTKFPSEPLEVIGALSMIALGTWFLLPGIEYPTGGVLHRVYNDSTYKWGYVLLGLGLYKTWGILWAHSRLHRLFAASLAGGAYFMILSAYLRSAPTHVMVMVMALWIVHQAWIAWRSQRSWRNRRR